jgi:four helix bundle protein
MQDFRNLAVWQKAHTLTLETYRATECFPRAELFGLTSQVRRSCASISANLAEGCVRTQPEFARFIQIALGSASETEYHFLLAHDLGFLEPDRHDSLSRQVVEVKRMLTSLQQKIQRQFGSGGQMRSK